MRFQFSGRVSPCLFYSGFRILESRYTMGHRVTEVTENLSNPFSVFLCLCGYLTHALSNGG